ncbi:MAG: hypothetical protein K6E50_05755 [Lachnospiraceae bacterium]|nr:hypothetical protein [Lachnospiraceae bacterium]
MKAKEYDMEQNWYRITDIKLLIIFGASLLWIVAGWGLYAMIGVSHGPKGGIDKIADALVYVFFWKLMIYVPPILCSGIGFGMWMFQNHRKAVIWVFLAIVVGIVFFIAYKTWFRKLVDTPEHIGEKIESFEKWGQEQQRYRMWEDRTKADHICEYVKYLVSESVSEFRSMYPDDDNERKEAYINAALEAHVKVLSHVSGWEYIPDVRKIIPERADADEKFLLDHRDLCLVAEHYKRELRRDHWRDIYQFEKFVVAEWYSWLPMMAVFYDDGTMDIVIAV